MNEKSLEADVAVEETPNFSNSADKLLNSEENQKQRVDINVLKARVKQTQDVENRKNITIFIFFLIILGVIGIYFSL